MVKLLVISAQPSTPDKKEHVPLGKLYIQYAAPTPRPHWNCGTTAHLRNVQNQTITPHQNPDTPAEYRACSELGVLVCVHNTAIFDYLLDITSIWW